MNVQKKCKELCAKSSVIFAKCFDGQKNSEKKKKELLQFTEKSGFQVKKKNRVTFDVETSKY